MVYLPPTSSHVGYGADVGPAQHRVQCPCGPDAAGDPRPARRRRPHRGRAQRTLRRLAAGDLATPQGARGGGPDLTSSPCDRSAQPPRGGAVARCDRMAGGISTLLDREPRAARRAARQDADGGTVMPTTRIEALPGLPFIDMTRQFDA